MLPMDNDSDDSEELPAINLDFDEPLISYSEEFKMPDAEVLLAQRLLMDNQIRQINQQNNEIAQIELEENENDVELTIEDLEEVQQGEGCITLNLEPVKTILNKSQLIFLEKLCRWIKDGNNLNRILSNMLASLHEIMERTKTWDEKDIIATCIILIVISTSKLSSSMVTHICNARKLLYYLLEEACVDVQINQLGEILVCVIPKVNERLELVAVLEGHDGENIKPLARGIIRQCLHEIFHGSSKHKWATNPYTTVELIPLVTRTWSNLKFNEQYILAQLISKNFNQLNNKNNPNESNYRNKLFSILSSKLSTDVTVTERCKLKILISRMQIYQNKMVHSLIDSVIS